MHLSAQILDRPAVLSKSIHLPTASSIPIDQSLVVGPTRLRPVLHPCAMSITMGTRRRRPAACTSTIDSYVSLTPMSDVPKAAVKPTREARRRRTAFILVSGTRSKMQAVSRAGDGCDARSQRPALEKDTRYPLVVCLLATRETAFLAAVHRGGQNVVTKRAVTMRIATLCCLIAGASAFGTLEHIFCWDGGWSVGSECMAGGNRRKSSLFYVRQTSERAETAAGQGRGIARRERGFGGGGQVPVPYLLDSQ